jgi:hypothetical protein
MEGARSERAFPTAALHRNPGALPSAAGAAATATRHFRRPHDAPLPMDAAPLARVRCTAHAWPLRSVFTTLQPIAISAEVI